MPEWTSIGKLLMLGGGILLLAGIIVSLGEKFFPFGHLPGDISFQKGNFSFHFPLVTCLILSVLISLFLNFLFR